MALGQALNSRVLQRDLLLFVGLRLGSGLLSFTLFALFARWFSAQDIKPLYYLLFLLGFFTSALRMLGTAATTLQSHESRSTKLRRLRQAYGQVVAMSLILVPVAAWTLSTLSLPAWAFACVVGLFLTWGLDIDILRAVLGRSMLLPGAAVVGGLLALAFAAAFSTVEAAVVAIFLQWLPTCVLNARLLWRWRRHIARQAQKTIVRLAAGARGSMAVALFDGLVLNAPFFLADYTSAELGRSVGIVMRIFVASLMLLPLLTFWSNGNGLEPISKAIGQPARLVYGGLIVITGLCAIAVFAFAFAMLSGITPTLHELAAAALLLVAFAAYSTAVRFGQGQRSRRLIAALLMLVLVNACCIYGVISVQGQAIAIAGVQSGCLLGAALLVARLRH
jgi:hypothetical protein